jgi:hypothetical protein
MDSSAHCHTADAEERRAPIKPAPSRFYAAPNHRSTTMPGKRPNEPIGPTTIPGQPTDPKIPPDQRPEVTPLDEDKEIEDGIEVDET